ncbi:hypothetical protein ACK8P5_20425 [Paenibacillus sp. EC2-1]|uniref:DUF7878 domain-containing protein n=1 Tax=Paenibacillus sp. EC2-1 TaxID=3388665 RepID=UPI003BEEFA91
MVDLSDKIRFDFRLNPSLDKSSLKEQSIGKTLHDVDGDFQIYIDDVAYFDEKEFLILEFGLLLKKWVRKFKNGEITNFVYNSIEHDSSILEFRYINGAWEVYSDWRISEKEVVMSADNLLVSSEKFLEELEARLMDAYEIKLKNGIF